MGDERERAESECGQALAEFALVAALAMLVIFGAAQWSVTQWRKVECLRAVFESAHSELLRTLNGQDSVTAEKICGRSHERLTLRTLQSFRAGEL